MKEKPKRWTKEQIENFLRQETTMMDDACKRMASTLYKFAIIDLANKCDPNDYTERKE
jgi:hypothetical protein